MQRDRAARPLVLILLGRMFLLLKLVQGVFTPKRSKCTFEVVDHRPRSVCVCAIGADSRAERDIVIDRRFFLWAVRKVRFLADMLDARPSAMQAMK